jgi:hypothetical protein
VRSIVSIVNFSLGSVSCYVSQDEFNESWSSNNENHYCLLRLNYSTGPYVICGEDKVAFLSPPVSASFYYQFRTET